MLRPTPYCLVLVFMGLAGCVKVSGTSITDLGDRVNFQQCLGKSSEEIKAILGDPLGIEVIDREEDEDSVGGASMVTSIHRYHASSEDLLIFYNKHEKVSKITFGGDEFTLPQNHPP